MSREDKAFVEYGGYIHLMGAIQGEHTVCGDAFDGCNIDTPHREDESVHKSTKKRVVTCPRCIMEIKNCRNVWIKEGE